MFLYLPWLKPILEIQNISKKFTINAVQQQPYLSLRDSLVNFIKAPLKGNSTSDYWALKDVSFNVMPGDTVGIIGKNGAGKSTLLKILSKITPPTSGKIICRGRIASLLEVGTGFHPELSGRENVFMNGSILGMRQTEIKKNFDAIVDFAGVEKFIDTPLKHYSSGMQLRLAFAVAAFLENEILIIDEVLAVGDAEFQKKCLGKMEDVTKTGRTVLFVSHSVNSLKSICKRGLLLTKGTKTIDSDMNTTLKEYLKIDVTKSNFYKIDDDANTKICYIQEIQLMTKEKQIRNVFSVNEDIVIEIKWNNKKGVKVTPNFELHNLFGNKIFWTTDSMLDKDGSEKSKPGTYISRVVIPKNFLNAGEYKMHFGLDASTPLTNYDCVINEIFMILHDPVSEFNPARGNFNFSNEEFALLPTLKWEYEYLC